MPDRYINKITTPDNQIYHLQDAEFQGSAAKSITSTDIENWNGKGDGTVKSVRVQATSPVQSSVSTAQTSTLNTTISLADGYGDTKNPYASKGANLVLAGPASGSAAAPSFRALQQDDISFLFSGNEIKSDYLPSYVDDVVEYASRSSFPGTGETGKIYIATDTNAMYRWSGTTYVQISSGVQNELASVTKYVAASATGGGSVTAGSAASFTQGTDTFSKGTLPSIDTTKFGGGSFSQGTDSFTKPVHGADSFTPASLGTGFYTAGTKASFTRGSFTGGSFTQGTDSFTANTPTAINTSKFSGGSFTSGTFNAGALPALSFAPDANDSTNLKITWSAGTLPSHGSDSFTAASLQNGFYTAGTAASFTQGTDSFTPATHAADSFTANTPTVIDVTKFSGGSYTQGSFTQGSFTQGTDSFTPASIGTGFFSQGTLPSFTQGEDSFTANTPTSVTLPSFASQTIVTGYRN